MSKALDNSSLILVSVGLLGELLTFFLFEGIIQDGIWVIFVAPFLIWGGALAGLIVAIIALVMKSKQKWKPILAICLFVLILIIYGLLAIMALGY